MHLPRTACSHMLAPMKIHIRSARGSTSPKTYVSPPRSQCFDITTGSGDDMEIRSNQTASFDPVLHSFLSRVESQGKANVLNRRAKQTIKRCASA